MRAAARKNYFYIAYAVGILVGTWMANSLSDAYVERMGIFQIYYRAASTSVWDHWQDMMVSLTMQRGILFLLLNLAVHNKRETILLPFFGSVYGMSLALMSALAVRTNQMWGFFFVLIDCIPQMVCYRMAWLVLQNGLSGYRVGIFSSRVLCIAVTLLFFHLGIVYEVFISHILNGLLAAV